MILKVVRKKLQFTGVDDNSKTSLNLFMYLSSFSSLLLKLYTHATFVFGQTFSRNAHSEFKLSITFEEWKLHLSSSHTSPCTYYNVKLFQIELIHHEISLLYEFFKWSHNSRRLSIIDQKVVKMLRNETNFTKNCIQISQEVIII